MIKFFFAILMAFAFSAQAQVGVTNIGSANQRCDYAGPDAQDPNCRTRAHIQDLRPSQDTSAAVISTRDTLEQISVTNNSTACWSESVNGGNHGPIRCLSAYDEAVVRSLAQRICQKVVDKPSSMCFVTTMNEITDALQGPLLRRR